MQRNSFDLVGSAPNGGLDGSKVSRHPHIYWPIIHHMYCLQGGGFFAQGGGRQLHGRLSDSGTSPCHALRLVSVQVVSGQAGPHMSAPLQTALEWEGDDRWEAVWTDGSLTVGYHKRACAS